MEINASVCMNKFSEVFENGKFKTGIKQKAKILLIPTLNL